MYESGQNGPAALHALRDSLRRLEAALARQEQLVRELEQAGDGRVPELLRGTAMLLSEEIGRLRKLLPPEA